MDRNALIGERIGNYVIASLLQEGGMGSIYVAEHPEIGRKVAAKVIPEDAGGPMSIAERFLTEAKALAMIDHPNIVQVFDFGRTDSGYLYYIMELLHGEELAAAMLRYGRMSPHEIRPYLHQICSALQAAHDKNVIHRDLKPENIFVVDSPGLLLKLLDFGLAKHIGTDPDEHRLNLTRTGIVMGTPYTIAPEQASGRSNIVGPQTDIYALGVILYWMIVGYPPFTAEETAVILAQHIRENPVAPHEIDPTLPPALSDLILRCLAKRPTERPASAKQLYSEFVSALPPFPSAEKYRTAKPSAHKATEAVTADAPDAAPAKLPTPDTDSMPTQPAQPKPQLRHSDKQPLQRKIMLAVAVSMVAIGGMLGAFFSTSANNTSPNARTPARSQTQQQQHVLTTDATVSAGQALSAPGDATTPADMSPSTSVDTTKMGTKRVVVTVNDLAAQCDIWIDGQEVGSQRIPCYLHVSAGQQVRLRVTRDGFFPYERSWIVNQDEAISLFASAQTLKIVPITNDAATETSPNRHINRQARSAIPKTEPRQHVIPKKIRKHPRRRTKRPKLPATPEPPNGSLGGNTVPF